MGTLNRLSLAVAIAASMPHAASAAPLDRWADPIAEASRRFGLPQDWVRRVIQAESGGRTERGGRPIVSAAGAMGLMQLMPATWAEMRFALGLGSDPHQPRDNILAGTAYLRKMYDRFGYPGLFAAYNAGPARFADAVRNGRTLPAETRAYVAQLTRRGPRAGLHIVGPAALTGADLFAILGQAVRNAGDETGTEPRSATLFFVSSSRQAGP